MSDSLAGINKNHELTIRYLDANYDLKDKSIEEYALAYETTYKQISQARTEASRSLRSNSVTVFK